MKASIRFIFGAVAVLLFATVMLIGLPYAQLSSLEPESQLDPYTELEAKGREQYVSLGCVYCHSQQPRDPAQSPADQARGWGRPSTPGDYAYDYPHQLGTMRTGPDLFNIGARQPSQGWHLTHLYQPRSVMPDSIMPSYPFLFELKTEPEPNDVVVDLPPDYAPAGQVVVARPEALALTAYLLALDHTYKSDQLPEEVQDE